MKHTIAKILLGTAAGSVLFAGTASAIDWNITGFVRQEIAYGISSSENPNNHGGNPFNNRITPQITHGNFGDGTNAAARASSFVDPNGRVGGLFTPGVADTGRHANLNPAGRFTHAAGAQTANPVDCHFAHQRAFLGGGVGFGPRTLAGSDGGTMYVANGFNACNQLTPGFNTDAQNFADVGNIAKTGKSEDRDFNTFNTRAEIDIQAKINREWAAYMKIRAFYDAQGHFTDAVTGPQFEGQAWGSRGGLTEWNTQDGMIDIPAFYFDWNRGPLWVRFGQQTIAWGEAYFFRTMDVANGLDLRRHLTLGPGAEEYQDQRIASPGIRVSYTFDNGWELDSFVQMWSPTILPGQNTGYNLIPVQGARLDDKFGTEDAEGSLNFGTRLTMPLTEAFTGIVAYVNRRNPDGVFHSSDAPTRHAGLVNTGCLNANSDTLNAVSSIILGQGPGATIAQTNAGLRGLGVQQMPTLNTAARNMNRGCGAPFAPDATGTPSRGYWGAVSDARIDAGNYLRTVINDWPAAEWAVRDIFGFGDELNYVDTYRTLEGFRSSFGPFIQWVGRQFKRENIFMVGGNYIVTMDDPNSLLDQLIIRGEVAVTPNKRLMNDLSFDFKEVDDIISALIFEKYHRISDAFPATYFVFQWMHRTATDLFGRDLDKFGLAPESAFIGANGNFTAAAFDPQMMTPEGRSSANYVVAAFQQPFPNLIWRFDMALLVDVSGGYLVQPGVRYRPAADWQWDLYATVIQTYDGDNDTITETLDWADEIFLRVTYFF